MSLNLSIVSPAKVEYKGSVDLGVRRSIKKEFEILTDHAPIISSLQAGRIVYHDAQGAHEMMVTRGFVEVQKNNVTICVEL